MGYYWMLIESVSPRARREIQEESGLVIDISDSLVLVGAWCYHLAERRPCCAAFIDDELIFSCTGVLLTRQHSGLLSAYEVYPEGLPPDWESLADE
jgi:hypothetical protein